MIRTRALLLLTAALASNGSLSAQTNVFPSSGNVGIGITNPGAKLDVKNTGDGAAVLKLNTDRPWQFEQLGTGSSAQLDFRSLAGSKWFNIKSYDGVTIARFYASSNGGTVALVPEGGNTGIGTHTPSERLHVFSDTAGISERIRVESRNFAGLELIGDRANLGGEPGGSYVLLSQDGGAVQGLLGLTQSAGADGMGGALTGTSNNSLVLANRYDNNSGYLQFATRNTVRMTIKGDGHVGIGTTSPDAKLHVHAGNLGTSAGNRLDLARLGATTANGDRLEAFYSRRTNGSGWDTSDLILQRKVDASPMGFVKFRSWDTVIGTGTSNYLVVKNGGNIGIGTDTPDYKLDVNGLLRAKEIFVQTGWADFVFEDGYDLPSLAEVETHIREKGHLPGIPSAQEVEANGLSVGEAQKLMMQKIEELTLYVLEIKKENQALQAEVALLKTTAATNP